MKAQVRVLAVDDAPFRFDSGRVMVVGVVMRLPNYLEGVLRSECAVDGDDANRALEGMVQRSRFKRQLKAVMIDGVALGGFNVVDIDALHQATGVPVITVTRDPPDLARMGSALRKHFPDWERRLEVLSRKELLEVDTGHKPIYVSLAGVGYPEAVEMIKKGMVRGAVPEPLRVAHIIASGLAKGESRGRA
ncbi:MAG: DUF99 family protein [Methanomassiliicoccales archaeon]|nr:DUF99 family protein [Methanomassiliicoccales archaeon]